MINGHLRPRRIAVVLAATALATVAGAGGAQASTGSEPDAAGTGTGLLGTNLLAADADLSTQLVEVAAVLPSLADTVAPLPVVGPELSATTRSTGKSVAPTAKKLPVLGPAVGGAVEGLTQAKATPERERPQARPEIPAAPAPEAPVVAKQTTRTRQPAKVERRAEMRPGVTWTAPMMSEAADRPSAPHRSGDEQGRSSLAEAIAAPARAAADLVTGAAALLPSTPGAAATAGAATVALIVLGGIAVTGAAGAASVAGRRELVGGAGAKGML